MVIGGIAQAVTIQADSVASIANSIAGGPGTHFHGPPTSAPAAGRELNGHAFGDETRNVSLFDLSGQGPAGLATLQFDVSGFFGGPLQRYDIVGFIDASGAIELSDFQAGPTVLQFAGFDPTGNPTAFIDITGFFNASLGSVLGMRIQPNFAGVFGVSDDHFFLSNFRIETANAVPEPGILALLGFGLAGLGLNLRRRRVGNAAAHSAAS
ncbi:MAG: PEP-CTERM sorting domain-containing protein [Geminicoccaceae bacterium]